MSNICILFLIVLKSQKNLLKCEVSKKETVQELYVGYRNFHLCNKLVQQQLVDFCKFSVIFIYSELWFYIISFNSLCNWGFIWEIKNF